MSIRTPSVLVNKQTGLTNTGELFCILYVTVHHRIHAFQISLVKENQ
jgi:hypothetical protein